jgi:hypothetical protein
MTNHYTRSVKLRPGQRGTKREGIKYGENLLSVRYRYVFDEKGKKLKKQKTVELIVHEEHYD